MACYVAQMTMFQYLMKLHYSQTIWGCHFAQVSFSTLWNYTTLKRFESIGFFSTCFSTLWNYTTLKPLRKPSSKRSCFSTLWNYTTLKPTIWDYITNTSFSTLWNYTTLKRRVNPFGWQFCFSTLWNYTTLKPLFLGVVGAIVSVPYEITLLSNKHSNIIKQSLFQYLMKLHYSQTYT